MADITVTPADVLAGASAKINEGTAGETVTAGKTVYRDTTDSNKLKQADANDTVAKALVGGIALHGASLNQPLKYQVGGVIDIGATLVIGTTYVQSVTAGGIAPIADLVSTNFSTVIGTATTTNNLKLGILVSGVAKT